VTTSDPTSTLPPILDPPWHRAVAALSPEAREDYDALATHYEQTLNYPWSSCERLALAETLVRLPPDQAEVFVAMTDPPMNPSEPTQ
jgi:hypothetical protein